MPGMVPPLSVTQSLRRQLTASRFGAYRGVMAAPPTVTSFNGTTSSITSAQNVSPGSTSVRRTGANIVNGGFEYYNNDPSRVLVLDFWSDSTLFELVLSRFNANVDVRVDVGDGLGLKLAQSSAFTTDSAGSGIILKLDWTAAATPGQPRRYRIAGQNFRFWGLNIDAGASIWTPQDRAPLMYFFGDSYTQATNANGIDRSYARTVGDVLGYEAYNDGIGGTGWTSTSTSLPTTRIAACLAQLTSTPDTIVTALGYNDAGGNMTTLATNYDAAVAAIRAAAPSARVVTVGPWTPLGTTANLTTVKTTLSGRAAALGVTFIDIENVVSSVNKAINTGGDNVHPTPAGHQFLGYRIAELMRAQGF
jgi:lysophospholipase L1-like esterase